MRRYAATLRGLVDPPGHRLLPDRVQREVGAEQHRADILIGVVQALLCVLFATLYVVAPKTQPAGASFAPVPWALTAYSIFTAFRLSLALRRPLPNWLQILSIVFDFSLLLGLIWSFHLQYEQVPAFYLKAPTLLYVFIFIALRALRFDVWHIMVAGGCAALGWLALVIYAAHFGPDPMPVTRDYVAYMTSPVILWGAEIDKIISILLVTLIVAAAIGRSRNLLLRAVAEGQAARDLKRFFAPDVASRITTADHAIRPGQGERREAAILFVDIRGFTDLSHRLDADALIALLAEYQSRMVPVIQQHGGSIDKFVGDGILASFGAVKPSASYAADAFRAAEELVSEAGSWSADRAARGLEPVRTGVGLASGVVLFGAVGDDTRLEYTVIGEPVNLAAKLEKQTKAAGEQALALATTHNLAIHQGYQPKATVRVRYGMSVTGVDMPLDVVALIAPQPSVPS
jgi:adenylate cyclase